MTASESSMNSWLRGGPSPFFGMLTITSQYDGQRERVCLHSELQPLIFATTATLTLRLTHSVHTDLLIHDGVRQCYYSCTHSCYCHFYGRERQPDLRAQGADAALGVQERQQQVSVHRICVVMCCGVLILPLTLDRLAEGECSTSAQGMAINAGPSSGRTA